jgi:methylmalonyl-CoA/ethylmalonyl-CoA epimerase
MLPLNLHHTAVAVRDLETALERFRQLFGVEPLYREVVEDQDVDEAMLPLGGSYLQLIAPLSADGPVGRFLERRGEGLHHVAVQVADIEAALDHLTDAGVELIDRQPRIGGRGDRIAFVHPRAFAGTLVELVEVT